MQVEDSPSHHDPRPHSWKYVGRTRGHSNRTWSAMVCLSMPTLEAFVVTRTWNWPLQVCRSSQNNRIRQNLSILSSNPLILTTLTKSIIWSSFFSRCCAKCSDWCLELQNTTTLAPGFLLMNAAMTVKPLEMNCAFLEQISSCMSISCCQNASVDPLRRQSALDKLTVTNWIATECTNEATWPLWQSAGDEHLLVDSQILFGRIRRKVRISSRNNIPCWTWMCALSIEITWRVLAWAHAMRMLSALRWFIKNCGDRTMKKVDKVSRPSTNSCGE